MGEEEEMKALDYDRLVKKFTYVVEKTPHCAVLAKHRWWSPKNAETSLDSFFGMTQNIEKGSFADDWVAAALGHEIFLQYLGRADPFEGVTDMEEKHTVMGRLHRVCLTIATKLNERMYLPLGKEQASESEKKLMREMELKVLNSFDCWRVPYETVHALIPSALDRVYKTQPFLQVPPSEKQVAKMMERTREGLHYLMRRTVFQILENRPLAVAVAIRYALDEEFPVLGESINVIGVMGLKTGELLSAEDVEKMMGALQRQLLRSKEACEEAKKRKRKKEATVEKTETQAAKKSKVKGKSSNSVLAATV